MNQDQWILLAFKVVEVASVVTIAAFIACYTRWARWFSNPIGRTIVIKDVALIMVLIPSILSIFWHWNRGVRHYPRSDGVADHGVPQDPPGRDARRCPARPRQRRGWPDSRSRA